jgi:CRP-like cAMP-binding protein
MPPSNSTPRNHILRMLSPADYAALVPHLESIPLDLEQALEDPDQPIEYVYFPESGYASIVAHGREPRRIEVGIAGFEGMTGLAVVTGDDRSPNETFIQAAGSGSRIASDAIRRSMRDSDTLRLSLLRYVQTFLVQVTQTALANGSATIEERLARWILMAHDRVDSDDLPLTHEFLAMMLGVRRPGVTVALHFLESAGLIRSTRGQVRVMDRAGLDEHANRSYGVAESEYERLMGCPLRRTPRAA